MKLVTRSFLRRIGSPISLMGFWECRGSEPGRLRHEGFLNGKRADTVS